MFSRTTVTGVGVPLNTHAPLTLPGTLSWQNTGTNQALTWAPNSPMWDIEPFATPWS
jgi:hypothetical protein